MRNELVTCEDSLRQEVVFVLSKNPVEVIKPEALVCTSDDEVNCWRNHYHEHCKEQVKEWGNSTETVLADEVDRDNVNQQCSVVVKSLNFCESSNIESPMLEEEVRNSVKVLQLNIYCCHAVRLLVLVVQSNCDVCVINYELVMCWADNAKYFTNISNLVIDGNFFHQVRLLIRICFGPNHKVAHWAQQQKAFFQSFILQDVLEGVAVEKDDVLWLLTFLRFLKLSSLSAHCWRGCLLVRIRGWQGFLRSCTGCCIQSLIHLGSFLCDYSQTILDWFFDFTFIWTFDVQWLAAVLQEL